MHTIAMGQNNQTVNAATLQSWLEDNKEVFILDVRPSSQREEWHIPGSHYVDAYEALNKGDESVLDPVQIPENATVVTVCKMGKTSQLASTALRKKGIEAYSLEGGMNGWSMAWNTAEMQFDQFSVLQIRRTGKGCLSYIIYSGNEAAILDASLPVEVYRQLIEQRGLMVRYVLETHIHADHLSRSKEIATLYNAPLFLPGPNQVRFPFQPLTPETSLSIGAISLQMMATPGHTLDSVGFYIPGKLIFTGDTLFVDGVGRPDLKANEQETRHKASLLYHALQKILSLPEEVLVLPAHTSKPVPFDGKVMAATIAAIKQQVTLLKTSEHAFVNTLLQKVPPTPANYLSIVEKNLAGDYTGVDPLDLEAGANRCAIS